MDFHLLHPCTEESSYVLRTEAWGECLRTLGFRVSTSPGTQEGECPPTGRKRPACEVTASALSSGANPEKAMARGSTGGVSNQCPDVGTF